MILEHHKHIQLIYNAFTGKCLMHVYISQDVFHYKLYLKWEDWTQFY